VTNSICPSDHKRLKLPIRLPATCLNDIRLVTSFGHVLYGLVLFVYLAPRISFFVKPFPRFRCGCAFVSWNPSRRSCELCLPTRVAIFQMASMFFRRDRSGLGAALRQQRCPKTCVAAETRRTHEYAQRRMLFASLGLIFGCSVPFLFHLIHTHAFSSSLSRGYRWLVRQESHRSFQVQCRRREQNKVRQAPESHSPGAGDDSVNLNWFGNSCIMMNLPHQSGRLTQR
jgi:hypothetical protein